MRALGLDPGLSDAAPGHRDLPASFHSAQDTLHGECEARGGNPQMAPPPADYAP